MQKGARHWELLSEESLKRKARIHLLTHFIIYNILRYGVLGQRVRNSVSLLHGLGGT